MRTLTVLFSILLLSALGFGQTTAIRGYAGFCTYGCGPYVPLITTPQLSLELVSPNPVGATNATGGLVAGATNGTLSQVSGDLDAVYVMPVWYAGGGTPLVSPAVNLSVPETRMQRMAFGERAERPSEAQRPAWIYFSHAEPAAAQAASAAQGRQRAARTYSNEDVKRQNQQNGLVKYDSKTEKIQ